MWDSSCIWIYVAHMTNELILTIVDRWTLTITELEPSVLFADFNLKRVIFTDEWSESSQTLTSTAADTNQQHVATWLTNHSHDSWYYTHQHHDISCTRHDTVWTNDCSRNSVPIFINWFQVWVTDTRFCTNYWWNQGDETDIFQNDDQ